MSARAAVAVAVTEEIETPASDVSKASDVLIHVRYSPNGEIFFIDALPAQTKPRDWLNLLLDKAPDCYQVFAGGRGFFRIPQSRFEAIKV